MTERMVRMRTALVSIIAVILLTAGCGSSSQTPAQQVAGARGQLAQALQDALHGNDSQARSLMVKVRDEAQSSRAVRAWLTQYVRGANSAIARFNAQTSP